MYSSSAADERQPGWRGRQAELSGQAGRLRGGPGDGGFQQRLEGSAEQGGSLVEMTQRSAEVAGRAREVPIVQRGAGGVERGPGCAQLGAHGDRVHRPRDAEGVGEGLGVGQRGGAEFPEPVARVAEGSGQQLLAQTHPAPFAAPCRNLGLG